MNIRRRGLAGLLVLTSLESISQTRTAGARVYGVVSLVADQLIVTGHESTTGTLIPANPTERIPLENDGLERSVLRATLKALTEAGAGRVVPLLISDKQLYEQQGRLVSGGQAVLPASLSQPLQAQQATHLVLITKHRADARMKTGFETLGSGRVEGLGFYVDRVTPLRIVGSGDQTVGYIAPHAYLRVWLIDLNGGRVVGQRDVLESRVVTPSERQGGADPWTWMDNEAKMKALDTLIGSGVSRAVRELAAS
jgi:hypothetical protein